MILAFLFVTSVFAIDRTMDAAKETLLWLREKERFTLTDCRRATKEDVRMERTNGLGDTVIRGKVPGKEGIQEINLTYYIRIRFSETAQDTLGSRLVRLGMNLLDVPTANCQVWNQLATKN